jgi:hypothetical protein
MKEYDVYKTMLQRAWWELPMQFLYIYLFVLINKDIKIFSFGRYIIIFVMIWVQLQALWKHAKFGMSYHTPIKRECLHKAHNLK